MAILKPGPLAADVRGKLGDIVFTRSQGGPTIRTIGTWTQPDTDAQAECRETLAALAHAWSTTLTNAQRSSWRAYARTNPRPNRWGQPSQQSGYLAFVRHNAHAYRVDQVIHFHQAPAAAGLHQPDVSITIARDTLNAEVIVPPTNYPTPPADLTLYLYSGIPINSGRRHYSGPYCLWLIISPPDAATPGVVHAPWTWPVHATEPPYTWPVSGTGITRAYAVAQDHATGAMSSRHELHPNMIEEQTW